MADNLETFSKMMTHLQKVEDPEARTQISNMLNTINTKVADDIDSFIAITTEFSKLEGNDARTKAVKAFRDAKEQLNAQQAAIQDKFNQAMADELEERDKLEQERIAAAVAEALEQERQNRQNAPQSGSPRPAPVG